MRDRLPEFYIPNEQEFASLWTDALFALDANVLLDIFRYSPGTSRQLLEVLEGLGDRVWVPYQAAFEYQRNRHGVVNALLATYDKAAAKFDVPYKEIEEALGKYADSESLLKSIAASIARVKKNLAKTKAKHASLVPGDRLHQEITSLLDGKVGAPYDEAELASRYKEAERRFKEQIPPGFKDSGKPTPERFGDFVLWSQLIDHATATGKPIILVTGDLKEDWWWVEHGKTIGPRPELRREMRLAADVSFYMYSPERFLENARQHLRLDVSDEAIAEARDIQARDAAPDARAKLLTASDQWRAYSSAALSAESEIDRWFRRRTERYVLDKLGYQSPTESAVGPVESVVQGPAMEIRDVDGLPVLIEQRSLVRPDGRVLTSLFFTKGDQQRMSVSAPTDWMTLDSDSLRLLYRDANLVGERSR